MIAPTFLQLFDQESFTYTYLLADENGEALIIDSVLEQNDRDLSLVRDLNLKLRYIFETHVHADHITGANRLRNETGAQTIAGAGSNLKCADILVEDGEEIRCGQITIKAIATPGHTDSCASYLTEGKVFTGDSLMIRACGRTDFQQGSNERLFHSVREKLFKLPETTVVYPAHDYKGLPSTTIGQEKLLNPRLNLKLSLKEFSQIMQNLKLSSPKKIAIAVPANLKCGDLSQS